LSPLEQASAEWRADHGARTWIRRPTYNRLGSPFQRSQLTSNCGFTDAALADFRIPGTRSGKGPAAAF